MAIGAALGAIGAVASPVWNAFTTLKGWQRDDRATSRMYAREDNAVQRRVSDLKAAGLSPVLAAGSAASTMQPVTNSSHSNDIGNPVEAYLATVQQRKNIDATIAGTELSKIQATSELFKQAFVNQQTQNLQSEKAGIDLRNSWINADVSSQLGLRSAQVSKINKELGQISANTALLQAKTAYEQVNKDFLMTRMDNEKILRDMNIIDRDWLTQRHQADIFNKFGSVKLSGLFAGGVGSIGSQFDTMFGKQLNRGNWYYPKN